MEYGIQYVQNVVGASVSPATLTAAFSGNQSAVYPVGGMHSIVLYCQYTPKAGQTNRVLYFQLELGPEEDDLYYVTDQTDVEDDDSVMERFIYTDRFTGATGGTTYKPRFATGDIADKYARFSFKEDGSSNFGTIYAKILYSGK